MENTTEEVNSPQTDVSVENVSTNDLRSLLNQTTTEVQEPQAPESQPEQVGNLETAPEGVDAPEEVTDQVNPDVEVDNEQDRLAKRRIRPKSDQDQQVIDLYRSEGFQGSFHDASRIIYGESTQPAQTQPEVEQPRQPSYSEQIDQFVSKAQAEIVDLNQKVREAAEGMDTVVALDLQQQVMQKQLNIQKAEGRKEQYEHRVRSEVESTRRNRSAESRDVAVSEYPQLDDLENPYRKEFDYFVTNAQSDPDYAPIFNSPIWPELLAREFGMMKGQQPASQQPVLSQAANPPGPQVGNQARSLTTGGTNQPINAPTQGTNDVTSLSNDDLYKLLGTPDGQRHLR
jgi:hypothetical protein